MAYKNVHKKIQRFKTLRLIEEKKTEGTSMEQSSYQLTEHGLYQLLLKRINGVYFDNLNLTNTIKFQMTMSIVQYSQTMNTPHYFRHSYFRL